MLKKTPRDRYLNIVRDVQDTFMSQYIHEKVSIREVHERILDKPSGFISRNTIQRFLFRGGKSGYKRGPYATTVFAIAEALGFELKPRRSSK